MGGVKKCSKCQKQKPYSDFYKNKAKLDRYCHYCKLCSKIRLRSLLDTDKHEAMLLRFRGTYQKRKAQGQFTNLYQRKKAKYPERVKARNVITYAIKSGKLKRQSCEVCGEIKSQAHHSDYSKPLDVTWLCIKHHMQQHRKEIIIN